MERSINLLEDFLIHTWTECLKVDVELVNITVNSRLYVEAHLATS